MDQNTPTDLPSQPPIPRRIQLRRHAARITEPRFQWPTPGQDDLPRLDWPSWLALHAAEYAAMGGAVGRLTANAINGLVAEARDLGAWSPEEHSSQLYAHDSITD